MLGGTDLLNLILLLSSIGTQALSQNSHEEISIELRSPFLPEIDDQNCALIKRGLQNCASAIITSEKCRGNKTDKDVIEFTYELDKENYDTHFGGADDLDLANSLTAEFNKHKGPVAEGRKTNMGRTVTFWINRKSFPSVTMSDFGDEFCEKLETSLRILSNSTGSRCRAKTLQGLKYNLKYKLPEAEKIPSMKEVEMCFRTSMHYGPSYVTLFGDTSKKELQDFSTPLRRKALRVSEHAIILETRTPIEEPILGKNCDLIKGVLESCFSPLLKSAPCEGDPNGDDVTEFVYDISPSIYDGQVNSQTEENMEAKIKAAVEENSTDKVETATEPKKRTIQFWVKNTYLLSHGNPFVHYKTLICDKIDKSLGITVGEKDVRCIARKLRGMTYDISYAKAQDVPYKTSEEIESCMRMTLHNSFLYTGWFRNLEPLSGDELTLFDTQQKNTKSLAQKKTEHEAGDQSARQLKRKTCRGCRSRKCRRSMIPPSVYGVPGFYPLPWPQKICLRGKCC